MKRTLLVLSFVILHLSFSVAQDSSKDMNKIKRDTMYIYAEATTKDLQEAYNAARAILELATGYASSILMKVLRSVLSRPRTISLS